MGLKPLRDAPSTQSVLTHTVYRFYRSTTGYDQSIVKGLAELMSHQHKQTIPPFLGYLYEVTWEDWIRDAERVAKTAVWDNEMEVRFFGNRLKHMALAYHEEVVRNRPSPYYPYWKKRMAERFEDKSAKETYKRALKQLKQTPNQRVQDFGNQIDELYKKAYGNSAATNNEPDAAAIREDIKKKILFVGLREAITSHMWVTPSSSYEEHLRKAIDVEERLRRRAMLLPVPPAPTVANVSESPDSLKLILDKLCALGADGRGAVNYVGDDYDDYNGDTNKKVSRRPNRSKETTKKKQALNGLELLQLCKKGTLQTGMHRAEEATKGPAEEGRNDSTKGITKLYSTDNLSNPERPPYSPPDHAFDYEVPPGESEDRICSG
jgi:hypothetical protein